jgi:hypothetical protein
MRELHPHFDRIGHVLQYVSVQLEMSIDLLVRCSKVISQIMGIEAYEYSCSFHPTHLYVLEPWRTKMS